MRSAGLILLLLLGAPVYAASLESLVSPGPMSAAHADQEEQCGACHALFSKSTQTTLCLDCHEAIAGDMARQEGFHGTGGRLEGTECRSCHSEHQGRDADIVGLVPEAFDHALTGFALTGGHADASCQDCHQSGEPFREASADCASCHQSDDPHLGNLGSDCAGCHDTGDWSQHSFDHQRSTDFALTGGHGGLACVACHAGQVYEQTPTECAACHALDDVHRGERGSDCAACHNESDWTDARFDHEGETGFRLQGAHADLSCAACHLDAMSLAEPPTECAGCHSTDDVHLGQRGDQCDACHDQSRWQTEFDHAAETGFALTGRHGELACDDCHRGNLDDPLPTECDGCHQQDDPHAGGLVSCRDCHDTRDWTGSLRFDHEFTAFPLLGMHRFAACEQCHLNLVFHETAAGCNDCHAQDDVHDGSLGTDCEGCHSPAGWERWQFDHGRQTDFALTGAHADLACAGCHAPGARDALDISTTCASCHASDDVHNGSFGGQCDRCHTADSFSELRGTF